MLTEDQITALADLAAKHARERTILAGQQANEREKLALKQAEELRALEGPK